MNMNQERQSKKPRPRPKTCDSIIIDREGEEEEEEEEELRRLWKKSVELPSVNKSNRRIKSAAGRSYNINKKYEYEDSGSEEYDVNEQEEEEEEEDDDEYLMEYIDYFGDEIKMKNSNIKDDGGKIVSLPLVHDALPVKYSSISSKKTPINHVIDENNQILPANHNQNKTINKESLSFHDPQEKQGQSHQQLVEHFIQKHCRPGNIFSSSLQKDRVLQLYNRKRLFQQIEETKANLQVSTKNYQNILEQLDKAKNDERNYLKEVNNEKEQLHLTSNKKTSTERQLNKHLNLVKISEEKFKSANSVVKQLKMDMEDALKIISSTERHIKKLEELGDKEKEIELEELNEKQILAKIRMDLDKNRRKRILQNAQEKEQLKKDVQRAKQERLCRYKEEAKEAQHRAVQRLQNTIQKEKNSKENEELARKQQHTRKIQSVISLKKNSENIRAKLRAARDKREQRHLKELKKDFHDKEAYLADGHNPYEIKRRIEQEKRYKADRKRIEEGQKQNENIVIAKMIEEDDLNYRKAALERKERKIVKEHGMRMAAMSKRDNLSNYLKKVTKDGREFIDPTSQLIEILPSQFSDMKYKRELEAFVKEEKKKEQQKGNVFPLEDDNDLSSLSDDEFMDIPPPFVEKARDLINRNLVKNGINIQKQHIFKNQVIMGKEFKGSAFISKPEVVEFKDFVVGEEYQKTVIITNVSFTFNSFKVLDLPAKIKDFFEIQYTPPGRMSAGISTKISVTFCPLVNQDIDSYITLLAETGEVRIPLVCLTRKCVLSFLEEELDFDTVAVGEDKYMKLRIVNAGALSTSFQTHFIGNPSSEIQEMFRFPSKGEILPYSTLNFDVLVNIKKVGDIQEVIGFEFDRKSLKPAKLKLKVRGVDVPIYLERELIHFDVCYYDHFYREAVRVLNRGNTAMKIIVDIPQNIRSSLEVVPRVGFVQPEQPFVLQLKSLIEMLKPEKNGNQIYSATFNSIM